jgi:cytochrome P450
VIETASLLEELNALFAGRQDLVDDPYPLYHRMRAEAPAMRYRSEVLVTRYADVDVVLRDATVWSHRNYRGSRIKDFTAALDGEQRHTFEKISAFKELWMSGMDAPEHTRLRSLIHKVFTPRRVAEMRPQIEAITADMIAQLQERGTIEAVHEYAYGLPLYVIAAMLGAPKQDWESIRDWSSVLANFQPPHYRNIEATWEAIEQFVAYTRALIEDRRRSTGQSDLLAALLEVDIDGDRLTQEELEAMFVLLFFAGHETTTNLISNGIYRLLTHPDQLARLRHDPGLITDAVEELLRYDTNVQISTRVAMQDVELAGVAIAAGTSVVPVIAAANRDPERFPDPDRLDITRPDNRHFGFSIGAHYCLGQALARMEAATGIGRFFEAFPETELEGEVHWRPNIQQRRVTGLPVRLNA